MSYAQTSHGEDTADPDVTSGLSLVKSALATLDDRIEVLYQRAAPVLRPERPDVVESKLAHIVPGADVSPVGLELRGLAERAADAESRIMRLLDRLAL